MMKHSPHSYYIRFIFNAINMLFLSVPAFRSPNLRRPNFFVGFGGSDISVCRFFLLFSYGCIIMINFIKIGSLCQKIGLENQHTPFFNVRQLS